MSKASDAVDGDTSQGIERGGTEANCDLRRRSNSLLRLTPSSCGRTCRRGTVPPPSLQLARCRAQYNWIDPLTQSEIIGYTPLKSCEFFFPQHAVSTDRPLRSPDIFSPRRERVKQPPMRAAALPCPPFSIKVFETGPPTVASGHPLHGPVADTAADGELATGACR